MTRQIGVRSSGLAKTIVDALAGWSATAQAALSGVHGLAALPATQELAGVELALAGEVDRETVPKDALDGFPYDHVVIDTPRISPPHRQRPGRRRSGHRAVAAGDGAQGVAELRATVANLARLRPAPPRA